MRRRTLALGAVVLAGAALLLFCCAGHSERTASAPPGAATPAAPGTTDTPPAPMAGKSDASAPHAALAAPGASSGAAGHPTPSDASSSAPSSSGAAGPGAQIAHALQTTDPRDLTLLAKIERELKRDPPAEIHALIAARKHGASRDELTRGIQALADLQVRVLAFRWLDAVAPAPDAGAR